ncbi:MAG: hypothetical protein JW682_07950, partial [Campylobacterales bacterium]|nr:hypothetical protein [Campylobacterales bacterium]
MAFVIRQKNVRGGTDVYYASSHRVDGKKFPVQTRKYLGKLDEGTGSIIKNRKLSNLTTTELSALEKAGISFDGRECPPPGRKAQEPGKVPLHILSQWHSLEFGRVAVLRMLSEQNGLLNALETAFGMQNALQILAVGIFECTEASALYRAENWIQETILAEEGLSFSKSGLDRLVEILGADESARSMFFREWIKECGYPKALIHDTTSISSYAERISMIEYGYNRDRERLPQLNFALVYTAKEQLPLVYRAIPGSIPDVPTLTGTSSLLVEYGLENFSYALDRGFYSKANLLEMLEGKIQFTIGAPLFLSDMRKLLDKHLKNLEKIENGLLVGDKPYRYVKDIFLTKQEGKRGPSYKLGAHLYMNLRKRSQMIQDLDTLLLSLQKQFQREVFKSREEALEWCESNFSPAKDLYVLNGRRKDKLKLSISESAYAEKIRNFGIFMILNSDPKADGVTTLYSNRHRDAVEKLFDILKNSTPNKRLRVASDTKAHGKMFLGFIAVILHTSMENLLRKKDML